MGCRCMTTSGPLGFLAKTYATGSTVNLMLLYLPLVAMKCFFVAAGHVMLRRRVRSVVTLHSVKDAEATRPSLQVSAV